jgi:thiamine-monophosphate kinase
VSATHLPLGPGPEFDRIRQVAARLGDRAIGLGDDCAVLPAGEGSVVLSTDTSIEGVHFRRKWLSLEEIGWRAATGALSDLAAAGASCVGLLAAVAAPRTAPAEDLVALMEGVGGAVDAVGGRVLGGDLTAGAEWVVGITVVGRATRPLSRRGARPGDRLWVTGTLGGARAALVVWEAGGVPSAPSRGAYARPQARLEAGAWLAREGARAMVDLSDGLAGDARHLGAASGVAIRIALEHLPVHPGVGEAVRLTGVAAEAFAAQGGEDYELLVALPPEFGDREARGFEAACGLPLTPVGDIEEGEGVSLELHGRPLALHGFDHFA